MAKLKNIIKQLSEEDYQTIYEQLMESNAEKSGHLLKFLREHQISDAKIMDELDVNTNAYYTLRSRLNQKISHDAVNLTKALQSDVKVQGNWGEMVLEKVLESSGLREGHEYIREMYLKDEDNSEFSGEGLQRFCHFQL